MEPDRGWTAIATTPTQRRGGIAVAGLAVASACSRIFKLGPVLEQHHRPWTALGDCSLRDPTLSVDLVCPWNVQFSQELKKDAFAAREVIAGLQRNARVVLGQPKPLMGRDRRPGV